MFAVVVNFNLILGTFSNAFSQAATSHRYFPELQLPTGIFQIENFSNEQFCKLQLPKCDQAAALCPLAYPSRSTDCSLRRLRSPSLTLGKSPLVNYLGSHPWENAKGQIHNIYRICIRFTIV